MHEYIFYYTFTAVEESSESLLFQTIWGAELLWESKGLWIQMIVIVSKKIAYTQLKPFMWTCTLGYKDFELKKNIKNPDPWMDAIE